MKMTVILLSILVAAPLASFAVEPDVATAPTTPALPPVADDEVAMRTILALNYCQVSISSIMTFNDKIILDNEYENIINNIDMEHITKDAEIKLLFNDLMDVLTAYKCREGDKEWAQKDYEKRVDDAIYSSLPSVQSVFASANPYVILAAAVQQVGSGYFNYKRNLSQYQRERDKALWELSKDAMKELNVLHKSMFNAAWDMAEKYKFPERYRLTTEQIGKYIEITKIEDLDKRLEQLEYRKDEFGAYPPFWYYYGRTAHDLFDRYRTSDNDKAKYYRQLALDGYAEFEKTFRRILRQDPFYSSVCMNRIMLLDPVADKQRIRDDLAIICRESKHDNPMIEFAALQYMAIGEYGEAKRLFRVLLAMDYQTAMNQRFLGDAFIESTDIKAVHSYSDEMLKSDKTRMEDILYLVGRAKDTTIMNRLKEQIAEVRPDWSEDILGKAGEVTLQLPKRWFYDTVDISVSYGTNKYSCFINKAKTKDDMVIVPCDLTLDPFYFSGGGMRCPLLVNIADPSYVFKLLYNISIANETVEFGLLQVGFDDDFYNYSDGQFTRIPPASKDSIAKLHIDILRASGMENLYVAPDISAKKIQNARTKFNVEDGEVALALFDNSMFGSAKDGIWFGNRKIYWLIDGEGPYARSYDELKGLNLTVEDNIAADRILLGKGASMRLKDAGWQFRENLIRLLKDLANSAE